MPVQVIRMSYFNENVLNRFTQKELKEGKSHVTELTDKWFKDIRGSPLVLSDSGLVTYSMFSFSFFDKKIRRANHCPAFGYWILFSFLTPATNPLVLVSHP